MSTCRPVISVKLWVIVLDAVDVMLWGPPSRKRRDGENSGTAFRFLYGE